MPTILEAAGIRQPETVDGIKQSPIEGVSMVYTFDKKNENVPTTHTTQYFEMFGDRAIYHDGWIASTKVMRPPWNNDAPKENVVDYPWELFDLSKDWTQADDVAAQHPDKVKEMKELFWQEAEKYQVAPLDSSVIARIITPRPSLSAGRTSFAWTRPITGIPNGDAPSLLNTSYRCKADIEIAPGGSEGMLVTQGGRFGGYGFYILGSKPVFLWNLVDLKRVRWEGPQLAPGKHVVEFDFKYDGLGPATIAFGSFSGVGRGGTGTLKIDGNVVDTHRIEHTIPFILQWDESLDIGSDTGTPVDDQDYATPFAFTGTIDRITLDLDHPRLSDVALARLKSALSAARDGPAIEERRTGEMHPTGDTPAAPIDKSELRIDKFEGCRKEAHAQGLRRAERLRFIERCVQ